MIIEPVEAAGLVWYVLSDERGYPLAQGSRELCEQSMRDHMARKGAGTGKKKTSDMQAALDFVACAITEHTTEHWRSTLQFKEGMMIASDGVISAGCKTSEEFACCPHFGQLKRVVERAALEGANFTQLDASKLAVTSGKFKAVIACLPADILPPVTPDQNIAVIHDAIKTGFETIGPIVKENGKTVVEASLLLQGSSMVACDRVIMAEYWHGIDLPPGMVLPKRFVNAIVATKKKLVGFGFTHEQSVTFWFEDASWIKSQMFSERWPESWSVLMNKGNEFRDSAADIPEGFYEAVAAVTPFSEDGGVYFDGNAVRSHEAPGVGASYDFPCPAGFSYSGAKLLLAKGRADKLHFSEPHKVAFFYSDDVRMIIAARGHAGRYSENSEQIAVPQRFQPMNQEPPQEDDSAALPGGVGDTSPGWKNSLTADPDSGEAGSEESGDPSDNWSRDPADAWRTNAEPPTASSDGAWSTRSDIPIPEEEE